MLKKYKFLIFFIFRWGDEEKEETLGNSRSSELYNENVYKCRVSDVNNIGILSLINKF